MGQISLQAAEKASEPEAATKAARLFFADHLRAALVILVVLHHVAIVYGEGVSFWYVEQPSLDSLTYFVLLVFVLSNQAWFMGALFLLAGYFTPGSFERKGSGSFLKERLIRLGIPLLIWIFLLNPISNIGMWLEPEPRIAGPLTWQSFWQAYPHFIGLGIAWFLALLLIFNIGYAAWRGLTKNRPSTEKGESTPTYWGVGFFILGLALITYLARIILPLGTKVLDFPTLAYLPQYLGFFIVGIVAYRRNWLRTLPNRMGVVGFVTAIGALLLLFPVAFFLGLNGEFLGNGAWQSAVYALWDSVFAVGMTIGSIVLFRRFFNKESRLGSFLAQNSYAVYLIHAPIVVFLAYLAQGVTLPHMVKFVLMSAVVIPLCFIVAWALRKIPGVSRAI